MEHRHIIGKTGTGKSTLAKGWLLDDIHAGHAVIYIDPHGYDTDDLLQYIPKARRRDVIVFDPTRYMIPWNPLATDNIPRTADSLATAMRVAYGFSDISTSRFSGVLFNAISALMEAGHGLLGIYLMLEADEYCDTILKDTTNPVVKAYWTRLRSLTPRDRWAQIESTYTKMQTLMADPRIRAIGGRRSAIDIADIVKDKVLFVRLPQGELGVEKCALIGNLLLVQIHAACLRRDLAVPLSLYIDEVHTFSPVTIREMLSGVRKFNVSLTAINQYAAQLDPALLDSLAANAEQYIFRVGYEDADRIPKVRPQDVQPWELANFEYIRFRGANYERLPTSPLPYQPYKTSAREIDANMRRNFVRPEDTSLLKFLDQ